MARPHANAPAASSAFLYLSSTSETFPEITAVLTACRSPSDSDLDKAFALAAAWSSAAPNLRTSLPMSEKKCVLSQFSIGWNEEND